MKTILLLTLGLGLWTLDVSAATYYAATSGSGTACTTTSRCSLTYAVNTKAVSGDTVNIGSGTYDICNLTPASGVTIQSESDLGAVWRCTAAGSGWVNVASLFGPLELKNKSNITIGTSGHGIYFNGSTNEVVIDIWISTASQSGISIRYNKFENNGNRGYTANGGPAAPCTVGNSICSSARQINMRRDITSISLTNIAVSNNTFTGNYGRGIVWNSAAGTVDSNTDTLRKSSQDNSFNGYGYNAQFWHGGQGGGPTTVSNNTITNYTRDGYVSTTPTYCNGGAGGKCGYGANPLRTDTGAANVLFTSNLIHDIEMGGNGQVYGIFTESGCDNNVATYNRIYRIGGVAMLMGSYGTNQNSGNNYSWNSIYDCECGIVASNAKDYVVKNNIIYIKTGTGAAVIRSLKAEINGIWKNNNFYNGNTSSIGKTGTTSGSCVNADKNLAAWDAAVGGTAEISSDPFYVNITPGSEDLSLLAGSSPSIHAADDGSDQGYLPLGNPPPSATITMIYPNGGEDLVTGASIPISWVTAQTGNCKVELARDGSNFSEVLSASTTCTTQTFPWTVTAPGRVTTALYKVTSLSAPTVTDTSDAASNIHGTRVSVLP